MAIETIIRTAEEQGIEHMAITDHIHPGTDRNIIAQVRAQIKQVKTSIDVSVACEADITAVGSHEVDKDLLKMTDYVMVSASHFHESYVSHPKSTSRSDVARHFLEMFSYAASLEFIDVIAHPYYVMPDTYDPYAPAELSADDLIPSIRMLKKNNIAVEISRRALAPEQTPFLLSFYRLCLQEGVKFSIGSDAHRLADVGRTRLVEPLVQELGLSDDNIWLPYGGANR